MKNVVIIGLGYVGFPLAQLVLERGYHVSGIDLDEEKLAKIRKGMHPLEPGTIEKSFPVFAQSPEVIRTADIIIIAVPTPVSQAKLPDLGAVITAATYVVNNIGDNKPLVIVESTINPGVMDEVIKPIFDLKKLVVGEDYFLAHCPERISPGDAWELKDIARVVGAFSDTGLKRAKKFYETILDADIKPLSCVKSVEAAKILENSFRDINIAFINEIAKSFDVMGIDVLEVIEGASTKPFAFMPHYPGCGVGGHCIPVDPYYLIEKAKLSGFDHSFLRKAREINESMPAYTVELLVDALNDAKRCLNGSKIGILGLSYKPNVGDRRESPSFPIMKLLKEKGATVLMYDPFFPEQNDVPTLAALQKETDVFVLCTAHEEFKKLNLNEVAVLVDGRNFFAKEKLTCIYRGIGRGKK